MSILRTRFYSHLLFWITIQCFIFAVVSPPSHALRFFYELGGGIAQVRSSQSFFNGASPSVLSIGAALAFGLGVDFYNPATPTNFHIGIQERYSSGSDATNAFSWHAPYLVVRLDVNHLLLAVGAAPIIWKRTGATAGIDSFIQATSSLGVLGELGLQWPITPEVSFAVMASTQSITTGSTWSPKPSIETLALLRFFLGGKTIFEKSRHYYGEGGMGEYEGYRYPYGWEIRH